MPGDAFTFVRRREVTLCRTYLMYASGYVCCVGGTGELWSEESHRIDTITGYHKRIVGSV